MAKAVRAATLRWAVAGIVSCLLAGCGSFHQPPIAQPLAASVACGEPIAGEEQLTAPVVVVGEIHGTGEIPTAFGHLVCHAAATRRGQPVLVGLEMLASAQPATDAFLVSAGDASAVEALLAQEFWRREYQDGRSSKAMLGLLDELRRLRKAGLKIEIRALDPGVYDPPSERDARMAARLAESIAAVRPAQTLVMVGNVHSRTLNGYPWDAKAAYVPLGALLRARYDVIALDVSTLGGSAWTCTSAVAAECGAHPMGARQPTGPTPRVELNPEAAARTGYDGVLRLGTVTASPPARRETPAPE